VTWGLAKKMYFSYDWGQYSAFCILSMTPVANLPPVSVTSAANFYTIFASVVDTSGKFATGVNDAGGKLPPVSATPAANLPPVSTTPTANLPPVSTTPVANNVNNIRLQTP
jgi:hypothetical protein